MSSYNISISINYPIERVFKVFIDLNKREIPKFNNKNPKDTSYTRTIKYVAKKKIEMTTTVTEYEKNKLYEVTNTIEEDKYISRYEFTELGPNSTELKIFEIQEMKGFSSSITLILEKFGAKKKLKNKANGIKEALEAELERRDGKSALELDAEEEMAVEEVETEN
ncbi:DUF3284 domain-containing protein [Clostridium tertium]|uniref:Polyketide cyclase / dehydrase and lipid transport n=1 Tax=Clostridium tertium TaxID=1559 RepID=A0A6N3AQR9_9CLOT